MSFRLFNTISSRKEVFTAIDDKCVRVYSCGPTLYNYAHLGNLRTFLFADLLIRYLRFKGYFVKHVMNFTDVDDKTIKSSRDAGVSLDEYTKTYKDIFFKDLDSLFIKRASFYPCATENIDYMIELIQGLLDKGYAYRSDGSVYFKISAWEDYGKFSNVSIDNLVQGASGRVTNDEYGKNDVFDFVLWKAYNENDLDVYWDSPFGRGRPGWHIECSAMSMKYLGDNFDIHTGGVDNIFPHHENEIAQSFCFSGKLLANYWMHSEFLRLNNSKISKSLGNVIYLQDLLDKGYSGRVVRFSLICFHYRTKIDYKDDILDDARSSLEGLNHFILSVKQINNDSPLLSSDILQNALFEFEKSMDDDLNVSNALASLFKAVKLLNGIFSQLGNLDRDNILNFFSKINQVLGIFDLNKLAFDDISDDFRDLINQRNIAKKNKDYKKADEIRTFLKRHGIVLEDTSEGVRIIRNLLS